jgi:hypothetical protein
MQSVLILTILYTFLLVTILGQWISKCGTRVLYPTNIPKIKGLKFFCDNLMPNETNFREYPLFAILLAGKCGECP